MSEVQSLFGTSSLKIDYIDAGQLTAEELILPNGAYDGFILTSDSAGVASWQPDPNTTLNGDAVGPLLTNAINTLAGGTINVGDLVTLDDTQELQNKTIGASNNVTASMLRNDSGSWMLGIEGDSPTVGQVLTYSDGFIQFEDLPPTDLTGDVISNDNVTKVVTVGGSTAANINSAELLANASTSANTSGTIVKRDASGNFSAGTITASLSGNASTATDVPNSAVIAKFLTGFSSTTGTVSASDSLLTFANKTTGNIAALAAANNGSVSAVANTLCLRDSASGTNFNDVSINRLLRAGGIIIDTSQSTNVLVGPSAGNRSLTGGSNTIVGNGSGTALTSATSSTVLGAGALQKCTTGIENTAIGRNALQNTTTASYNTAVGTGALSANTTGGSSCAFGWQSLNHSTTTQNTAYGYMTGTACTGSNNVLFGAWSGATSLTSGSQCTLLGDSTNVGTGTLTNATAVGYGATVTQSNTIQMGNSSVGLMTVPPLMTTRTGTLQFPGTFVASNIMANHITQLTSGVGVTVTTGQAAGGGSATITGNDAGGTVSVIVQSTSNNGPIVNVIFGTPYASAPYVTLTAGNAYACQMVVGTFVIPSTTGFSINSTGAMNVDSTHTFTWYYNVVG